MRKGDALFYFFYLFYPQYPLIARYQLLNYLFCAILISMRITLSNFLPKDVVRVIVVKSNIDIAAHPFFKDTPRENKKYLEAIVKRLEKEREFADIVLLPLGGMYALLISLDTNAAWRRMILTMRKVIAVARKERMRKLAVRLEDFIPRGDAIAPEIVAEVMALQFELANFDFVEHKTPPKEGWSFVQDALIYTDEKRIHTDIKKGIERGKIIGEETNKARHLSNTPGGIMTPRKLADAAARAGKISGFKTKILQETEMRKLAMGGVIGVSQGSSERPRFIVMEYLPAQAGSGGKKSEKPVVLVGKGVTFDTGGLNLKPTEHIYEMHMDMSGGAAVIHTLAALARMKVKRNVVGLVPAVENMPSGSSYHPGDLLRTMSGKTIEVLNTDAEGRIILADALHYAKRYDPGLVIDVATLTGSAMAALGQRASAIFATHETTSKRIRESGETVGDFVWPLPLWEEYEEEIRGTFGDVANAGKTRYGDAVNAAVFLWQFIKGWNWVHLDIAPRMTAIEGEFLAKGAAGASVPLLSYFLSQ